MRPLLLLFLSIPAYAGFLTFSAGGGSSSGSSGTTFTGGAVANTTTFASSVTVKGKFSSDNGAFSTDGSGNLTATSLNASGTVQAGFLNASSVHGGAGSFDSDLKVNSGVFEVDASGNITGNSIGVGGSVGGSVGEFGSLNTDGGLFTTDGSGDVNEQSVLISGSLSVNGGATSLDNGQVTTDGSGGLTVNGAGGLIVTGASSLNNGNITTDGSNNLNFIGGGNITRVGNFSGTTASLTGSVTASTATLISSAFSVGKTTLAVLGGSVYVGTGTAQSGAPRFEVFSASMSVIVSTQGAIDFAGGPVPTFTGCGTTPTLDAGSNCTRGGVTMTASPSSTCVLAFPASCFAKTPHCQITGGGAGTAIFFQQSGNLTGACDNATGLVACGVGTYMTWVCLGN